MSLGSGHSTMLRSCVTQPHLQECVSLPNTVCLQQHHFRLVGTLVLPSRCVCIGGPLCRIAETLYREIFDAETAATKIILGAVSAT